MKRLLLPLIILLLIIGYFMAKKSDHTVDDAYDKLEKPPAESTRPMPDSDSGMPDSTTPPTTVPDPTVPDTTVPPDGDDVAPITDDPQTSGELRDEAREAGDAIKGAAKETGDVIKDAAEDAGDAIKDAGDATKDAAEDALDKIRGEDKPEEEPQQ